MLGASRRISRSGRGVAKRPAVFDADARDADEDGLVQEGTTAERPATPKADLKKYGGWNLSSLEKYPPRVGPGDPEWDGIAEAASKMSDRKLRKEIDSAMRISFRTKNGSTPLKVHVFKAEVDKREALKKSKKGRRSRVGRGTSVGSNPSVGYTGGALRMAARGQAPAGTQYTGGALGAAARRQVPAGTRYTGGALGRVAGRKAVRSFVPHDGDGDGFFSIRPGAPDRTPVPRNIVPNRAREIDGRPTDGTVGWLSPRKPNSTLNEADISAEVARQLGGGAQERTMTPRRGRTESPSPKERMSVDERLARLERRGRVQKKPRRVADPGFVPSGTRGSDGRPTNGTIGYLPSRRSNFNLSNEDRAQIARQLGNG